MKIKELLSSEGRWTQGTMARNARGLTVGADSDTAVQWCILGAAQRCYMYASEEYLAVLQRLREICEAESYSIAAWNDELRRTFDDVKALVNTLDI